jgi:cobalt-zinc-cadmium efflux system protein
VLGDAVGSIAAIVAGAVILLTGWMPIDPILSFLVAGILVWGGWRLLRETTMELMESVPTGFHVEDLQAVLDAADGVAGTHHVHVWRLPSGQVALSAHVQIESMEDWSAILPALLATLRELGVSHATLQPEIACPDGHC